MTGSPGAYTVYVLRSESTGRYYIGQTSDLERRLWFHQNGKCWSTRRCGPWSLVHREEFTDRGVAVRRERQLKAMKSRRYLEGVVKAGR